jgi:shikimate dehydrogenase
MHEAAYETLGIDARYVTFEPSREHLALALSGADTLGIRGLNVTIPFKEDILPLVEPDPLAERIGAVNTVDLTGETVTGYNTDAVGVTRALEHHDVDIQATAVVVGAGGAGRAAAFGLADEGVEVRVANRTIKRAESLANDVPRASAHALDELGELVIDTTLLINATSVGMGEDASIVAKTALHDELTVLDMVYDPIETRLLREAREAGARTIDGAWMLLFQGAAAFERWTGHEAPVNPMNKALRVHI